MKMKNVYVAAALYAILCCGSLFFTAGCQDSSTQQETSKLSDFRATALGHRVKETVVKAKDGVELYTLVYLPQNGEGPFPTLVTRTPYDLPLTAVSGFPSQDKFEEDEEQAEGTTPKIDLTDVGWSEVTDRGYALVIQFDRGRFKSGGVDSLFLEDVADGESLLEWVESQAFCDGRIGIFGDSASGAASLMMAASGRPSIKAIYAQATTSNFIDGAILADGRAKWEALLTFSLSLGLEASQSHYKLLGFSEGQLGDLLNEAGSMLGDMFENLGAGTPQNSTWWTSAPTKDFATVSQLQPRWGDFIGLMSDPVARAQYDVTSRLKAPLFYVTLWHDVFQASTFETFGRIRQSSPESKMMVLDGTHYEIDDPALWPYRPMFEWFDYHLLGKQTQAAQWPVVRHTIAGQGNEALYDSNTWPLEAQKQVFTLTSEESGLKVDPSDPTPTLGGSHLILESGMLDQAPLLSRPDVILTSGEPLEAPVLLAGSLELEFDATLVDGTFDLSLRLVDVAPDGSVTLIREQMLFVGEQGAYKAQFSPIVYEVDAGHSLSLVLAGGSFPAWSKQNLAQGGSLEVANIRLSAPLANR